MTDGLKPKTLALVGVTAAVREYCQEAQKIQGFESELELQILKEHIEMVWTLQTAVFT